MNEVGDFKSLTYFDCLEPEVKGYTWELRVGSWERPFFPGEVAIKHPLLEAHP
jgi:hypothetical protein